MMRLLCLSLLALTAFGQTAQITGRVTDPTDAVVPGVEITVTNTATSVVMKTSTNASGIFTVPLLPVGSYRVEAQKAGFRPVTHERITLAVDQVARLDIVLQVGQITQAVEVSAVAPILQTDSSALGQVVDSSKIANLPLNGRSPFRLVQLTPGILSAPSANGQFGDLAVNTTWDSNFSINGGRFQSNEVQIDGVPSTAGFFNQITTIPSVEATQEFKVQSNNLSAEWGRSGGGVLNVSTKSGTNELHGTLYEFLRNSAFDANEFFNNRAGRPIPPFRMNQFGGSAGGPLVLGKLYNGCSKTFFFADYQGSRWRRGSVFFTTVPTALERTGDFGRTLNNRGETVVIYDPLTTIRDPARAGQYIRSPFAANAIPASRIDPIARKLIEYFPQPNTAGDRYTGFNNFVSNASRIVDQNQFSGRMDHNFSERHRIYGRFARMVTVLTQPDVFANVATPGAGSVGTTPFRQHTFAFDDTLTLSATAILDIRYGFARWYQLRTTRSYGFDQRQLGFPASLVSQFQIPVFPAITIDQYSGLGGQSYLDNGNDTHSILPSLTWIAGKHTLKFGGDMRLRRINYFNNNGAGGSYTFNRIYTRGPDPNRFYNDAGNGMASLLLGMPASGRAPLESGASLQNWYWAGYVQDDLRLTSRLTVNFGLRYETESPYTERRNSLAWFDSAAPSPARNTQFPNLTGALHLADDDSRHIFDWDRNNFAPRAGIAYTLFPRTVIRAGAGLFYSPLEISNNAVGFIPNPGYSSSTPLVASVDGGLTPFRTLANPFPEGLNQPTRNSLGASTYLGQGLTVWDQTPITPTVWQWNFDVQQQIARDLVFDIAYAGSKGTHLAYRNREINALDPKYLSEGTALLAQVTNPFYGTITTGQLAQPRVVQRSLLLPYPQYTSIQVINSTSANSNYHSLQLKLEKRFSADISFLVAFTGAKLLTDANSQVAPIGPGGSASVQNWYDLRSEKGLSESDVARNLTVSYVVGLPFGPGKALFANTKGLARRLAEGWQVNGVTSYRSGVPLMITAPIPNGGNRPNSTGRSARISEDRPRGEAIEKWFDTAQFVMPASFTLGNVGRTLPDVRGPNLINVDFSLIKNTTLWERATLQFRAEAFNAFNRPNFWLPVVGMGSGQFGQVNSTTGQPRVGQLALKLMF